MAIDVRRAGASAMDLTWLSLITLGVIRGLLILGGYLTGEKSFPRPLSPAEELQYVQRMRQGDEQARAVLIERNMRLVAHVVKKFDGVGEDEDLISIGTIGLIKAIDTFDPTKGTRLGTYAARCIENEILMYLRGTRRSRRDMSLHDPIGVDRDGNEITLMDVLQADNLDMDEIVSRRMLLRSLLDRVQELGPRERRVLELRFGLGGGGRRTQREVAKELGISRSYVSRIEKRAMKKLFALLGDHMRLRPAGEDGARGEDPGA